ncbi:MAG: Flp family type IVb pilin [Nitrospinota bacterium]
MWSRFHRLWQGENGQGLMEYVLILMLVAVAVVASLTLFGGDVQNFFTNIVTSF